jgi:hypothetical protein
MYRIRGNDILQFTAEVLCLIAQQEPGMFADRGRTNLRTLSHPKVGEWEWTDDELQRIGPLTDDPNVGIDLRRRRRSDLQKPRSFLAKFYNHAVTHPGETLEELQASWKRELPLRKPGEAG